MNQTEVNHFDQLSNQKLLLLGLGSVLLCLSMLMSVLTPYPLILALVLFGRTKGVLVTLGSWFLVLLLSSLLFEDLLFLSFYTVCAVFAFGIAEVILRKLPPVKSIVAMGITLNILVWGVVSLSASMQGGSIKQMILNEIKDNEAAFEQVRKKINESGSMSKESIEVLSVLDQPELLAKEMIETAPAYIFIGIFFLLWANMFLVLSARNFLGNNLGSFNQRTLVEFKMPDHFIWPVIISLGLSVWGNDLGVSWLAPAGLTVLKCLGVFYFFQGFGIYLDFLNFAKIKGFFRTFLVVITVFSAGQVIAVIGLFDMFINFRRFFNKSRSKE